MKKVSETIHSQDPFVVFRDPDWIQTNDPQLRRLLLYSTELPDRFELAKIGEIRTTANGGVGLTGVFPG